MYEKTKWFYQKKLWIDFATSVRMERVWCEHEGCVEVGKDVHHTIPLSDERYSRYVEAKCIHQDWLDPTKVRLLCRAHHLKEEELINKERRTGSKVIGTHNRKKYGL